MKAERITQHSTAHEQLLYFTSSSLTSNDDTIVFISDRTGHPNIFARCIESGAEQQLSNNSEGSLKSYVYFNGSPYRGLGKASPSFHTRSGTLYYIQGCDIMKVTLDGHASVLAQCPEGQMTAFTHISNDGTRLCVPTTDERALDGSLQLEKKPAYDIDERVVNERLSSYLRVFDTKTGEELICEQVEQAWITHVQFSPTNNDLILYNHEWASDCGIRRMWLFDGKAHTRLRTEGDGRSKDDWVCHEMWERDGSAIIYHGRFDKGADFIGHLAPDGTGLCEIALPSHFKGYGHFTVGAPNVLISDGYYRKASDPESGRGIWIARVDADWNSGHSQWTPLCKNLSSWDSQDAHPHPIIDHSMRYAYFTSDMSGKRAIYRIEIA